MQSAFFYQIQLVCIALVCVAALYVDWTLASRKTKEDIDIDGQHDQSSATDNGHTSAGKASRELVNSLKRRYLVVYGIVMSADWLQGPSLYSLYKEQYQFPERVVALFFVTGFLSAGIAAPFVGSWADQSGRKRTCLLFCITYTLSCICITQPHLPILLMGRILGGMSTSILFSVFETWLVSEATCLSVNMSKTDLSTIMGRATLLNAFVATSAGVLSYQLVGITGGNFKVPYMASTGLLIVAWMVIRPLWTENYGSTTLVDEEPDVLQIKHLKKAWGIVCRDPVLVVLGLTQMCFEGSMYLFVFLWVPLLQESSATPQLLPLEYIFSSFMVCMMLGLLLYTSIINFNHNRRRSFSVSATTATGSRSNTIRLHAQLSSIVTSLGAISLGAIALVLREERARFYAFCVFEVCVGMYYPVQGTLRAGLIDDGCRATIASLFRVPLNLFVVISLLLGVSEARTIVLLACAGMLTVSSLMTAIVIGGRREDGNGNGHRDSRTS